MTKAYVLFGILVCVTVAHANRNGWVIWKFVSTGSIHHHTSYGGGIVGGSGFHAK